MRSAKRVGAIGMAALLYHQLLSSVAPQPAQARVEPLTRITGVDLRKPVFWSPSCSPHSCEMLNCTMPSAEICVRGGDDDAAMVRAGRKEETGNIP